MRQYAPSPGPWLFQLGPRCIAPSIRFKLYRDPHQTCSNLFIMKHILMASERLAFYLNAFLFYLRIRRCRRSWRVGAPRRGRHRGTPPHTGRKRACPGISLCEASSRWYTCRQKQDVNFTEPRMYFTLPEIGVANLKGRLWIFKR